MFGIEELKEYVRLGNAVASLCVEKKGAIPAMPTLEEVEKKDIAVFKEIRKGRKSRKCGLRLFLIQLSPG